LLFALQHYSNSISISAVRAQDHNPITSAAIEKHLHRFRKIGNNNHTILDERNPMIFINPIDKKVYCIGMYSHKFRIIYRSLSNIICSYHLLQK
jgi:hypothetical protein